MGTKNKNENIKTNKKQMNKTTTETHKSKKNKTQKTRRLCNGENT